jgi:hypothetical protein
MNYQSAMNKQISRIQERITFCIICAGVVAIFGFMHIRPSETDFVLDQTAQEAVVCLQNANMKTFALILKQTNAYKSNKNTMYANIAKRTVKELTALDSLAKIILVAPNKPLVQHLTSQATSFKDSAFVFLQKTSYRAEDTATIFQRDSLTLQGLSKTYQLDQQFGRSQIRQLQVHQQLIAAKVLNCIHEKVAGECGWGSDFYPIVQLQQLAYHIGDTIHGQVYLSMSGRRDWYNDCFNINGENYEPKEGKVHLVLPKLKAGEHQLQITASAVNFNTEQKVTAQSVQKIIVSKR